MMAAALTALPEWLARWAELYRSSVAVQAIALYGHLTAVVLAAAFALGADQKIVRARRGPQIRRVRALRDWRRAHRFVLAGLALGVLAGLGLLLSNVPRFLPSWIFWLKMTLLAVLVANGRVLKRDVVSLWATAAPDHRGEAPPPDIVDAAPILDDAWDRLAHAALRSAWLWAATLLAGVLLTTA